MDAARAAHTGVSFRSKNIGLFSAVTDQVEDVMGKYTLSSDADDEEEKAVTTATLATFFVTFFVAMAVGLICGICCCIRKCGLLANKSNRTDGRI